MNTPSSWKQVRLGTVVTVNPPCARPSGDTSVTFVSMADVSEDAKIVTPQIRTFASVETGFTSFEEGDVLVAKITPCFENGKGAFACNLMNGRGAGSTEFHVLRANPKIDSRFLHWLSRDRCFRNMGEAVMEGSAGQKRLPASYLRTVKINLPPLAEQRKIADILTAWDEALEKLAALIAAKERCKKGLMQQLLTGKLRLKGFAGKWRTTIFEEFLQESRIPGSHGKIAHKITVKLYGKGVYAKQEKMVGSENTKYFVRRAGQFIYSKLDFLNGAFGIVPPSLDGFESTLDLPTFDVAESCDAHWLLAHVSRPEFYTRQVGAAAGGRKARRVNPSEFLALSVRVPETREQTAIAAILDACDDELNLLRAQRAALDQQKRGLMQRLLTGRVRVKVEKEAAL